MISVKENLNRTLASNQVKLLKNIIISDIDGTLIYRNQHLNTKRFPIMLDKLSKKSIEFALATGRNFTEIVSMFGEQSIGISHICCDGAYVISGAKCIASFPIDRMKFSSFSELIDKQNVLAVEFHGIGNTYILGAGFSLLSREKRRLSLLCQIKDISEIDCDIYKITVLGSDLTELYLEGLRASYISDNIIEYVSDKASKLSAIKLLCSHFDTDISNVTYFGDSENDKDAILSCADSYTTYCANKKVFGLTKNHTRDVIGTIIRISEDK